MSKTDLEVLIALIITVAVVVALPFSAAYLSYLRSQEKSASTACPQYHAQCEVEDEAIDMQDDSVLHTVRL